MTDADPERDETTDPNDGTTEAAGLPKHRLRESVVKPALEALDWTALQKHLDETGLDDAILGKLLGYVRRTSSLIMPYPNERREGRRQTFLGSLQQHARLALGDQGASAVAREVALIDRIERGYRGILEFLDQCDIAKLPADQRAAASIGRAAIQFTLLIRQVADAIRTRKEIAFPHAPVLTREDRTVVSAESVITSLVEALTITLQMEAHKNGWFDADGTIVLPPLPVVGEDVRYKAGSTEVEAMFWRRWRRTEERLRFLGGAFEEHAAPDLPAWAPEGTREVTAYHPDLSEIVDYIANERLNDRLGQTLLEMLMETNLEARARGIKNDAPLLPATYISAAEGHSAVSLSEILSYSIVDDDEQPGGLRLVEWLRGYAVLNALAEERAGTEKQNPVFVMPRAELLGVLERCGLSDGIASRFVDAVTLNRSSRDMFDSPLIKMADGALMVFGPGLINTNPARVVLSTLATLGEPLSRKGKAFERDILNFFNEKGLHAGTFMVHREGEQYDYDVVLVWGQYVFLFECKNHNLSNHHPVQAYRCEQEIRSNIRQVKRLADALRGYPDILRERMGVDLADKTIVPCVLNALPYAFPGPVDGVYVFDASALKRFFNEKHFRVKTPYRIDENIQLIHRVAMHSAWAGDKPAPEDLVRQLEEPFQLLLILAHTEIVYRPFRVGATHLVAAGEFHRTEITLDSYSELVGVSAEAIRLERAEVAKQVKKVRARLKARQRRRRRKKQ